MSSSLYEAGAWFSTGLGDHHTHDAQLAFFACGYNPEIWRGCLRIDPSEYFDDPDRRLAPDAESVIMLANPVQPHSEGEVVLARQREDRIDQIVARALVAQVDLQTLREEWD